RLNARVLLAAKHIQPPGNRVAQAGFTAGAGDQAVFVRVDFHRTREALNPRRFPHATHFLTRAPCPPECAVPSAPVPAPPTSRRGAPAYHDHIRANVTCHARPAAPD